MDSPPKRQVILLSGGKKKTFKPLTAQLEQIGPEISDQQLQDPSESNLIRQDQNP